MGDNNKQIEMMGHISFHFCPLCQNCYTIVFFIYVVRCDMPCTRIMLGFTLYNFDNKYPFIVIHCHWWFIIKIPYENINLEICGAGAIMCLNVFDNYLRPNIYLDYKPTKTHSGRRSGDMRMKSPPTERKLANVSYAWSKLNMQMILLS